MAFTFSDQDSASTYGGSEETVELNVSAGDLIVVIAGAQDVGYCDTVVDEDSNSYTVRSVVSYSSGHSLVLAYAIAGSTNAALTITAGYTAGPGRKNVIGACFTPDSGETVSLDVTMVGGSSWEDSPWETGTDDTTGTDELCIAGVQSGNTVTYSGHEIPGATAATELTSPGYFLGGFYRILTATASGLYAEVNPSATGNYAMEMLCFKSEAAGVDINPGDVEGLSTVAASSLNFTRSLAPEDVASQSTVAASELNRVRPINPGLVTSESTVAASSLNFMLSLNPENVLSQSTVAESGLIPVRAVYPGLVDSQSAITQPALVPIRLIDPQEVESQSTVDISVVNRIRTLGYGAEEYNNVFLNAADAAEYETYTTNGLDITEATNTASSGRCYYNDALDTNKLYRITFDYTYNSGVQPYYRFATDIFLTTGANLSVQMTGTGTYTFYAMGNAYHGFKILADAGSFAVANLSVKEISLVQSQSTVDASVLNRIRDINAEDVESQSTVAAPSLNFTWSINAGDVSCQSTVAQSALVPVRLVDPQDVESQSTVSESSVVVGVTVNAGDVECQSTVAQSVLTTIRLIDADDVASQSTVSEASVEVAGVEAIDINADDVSCQSTVAASALTPIRAIGADNVSSQSTVAQSALIPIRALGADDVSSQATVAQSVLDAVRSVVAGNVASQSTVAQSSVDRVRPINAGDVASQSTVSEATVDVIGEPVSINAGDVSCQSEVIVYGTEEIFVDDADGAFVDDADGAFVDDYPGLTPLLTVIRWTQPDIVSSQSTVAQSILDAIRLVDAGDVESQSIVTAPTLDTIRFIQPQVVESLATIAGLTLVAVRPVNAGDVESQSILGPGVLNAIYLIQGGDVESQAIVTAPNLTIVGVTAQRLNRLLTLGVSA